MKVISTLEQLEEIDFNNNTIISIIPLSNFRHPARNKPILVYLYNIETKSDCMIVLDHLDYKSEVDINSINTLLEEKVLYTLDKKEIMFYINSKNVIDLNLYNFFTNNKEIKRSRLSSVYDLIYENYPNFSENNKLIPVMKHYEYCKLIKNKILTIYKKFNDSSEFRVLNEEYIPALKKVEENGIFINKKRLINKYTPNIKRHIDKNFVYSNYNLCTATGRPSNNFGGINFSALSNKDDTRKCFISRFGKKGLLLDFDYISYHMFLAADLIDHEFEKDESPYYTFAKEFFNTTSPTKEEIDEAKTKAFYYLYSSQRSNIKFFVKIEQLVDTIWEEYNNSGVIPIINKKIFKIDNKYKLFNYFMQSYETLLNISTINNIHKILENHKTKLILYTYDSFTFDFCIEDDKSLLEKLKKAIGFKNFRIRIKYGTDYFNMKKINVP